MTTASRRRFLQHTLEIRVRVGYAEVPTGGGDALGVDVEGGDDLHPVLQALQAGIWT